MSKTVSVLIKDRSRQYEGLRTSLGLLLEDHKVNMIVLDHQIETSEEYLDNMTFIDEMGGARYSNVPLNVEKYKFKPVTTAELSRHISQSDLTIPF